MTLQAVMGQGFINAVTLDKLTQTKGALLSIEASKARRLSTEFRVLPVKVKGSILAIDWVHSTSPLIDEIALRAGIPNRPPADLEARLRSYIATQALDPHWSEARAERDVAATCAAR